MINTEHSNNDNNESLEEHDFHGAAIIDKNGKELPITDEMVEEACQETPVAQESSANK